MKIIIINPYWHILGGGERYLLSIAKYLNKKHEVFLVAEKNLKQQSKQLFNISLEGIKILPSSKFNSKNFLRRYMLTCRYDVLFFMTDGSVFFPPAKKNYFVIQSPAHMPVLNTLNRIKLNKWKIICYSQFMKKIIESSLKIKAQILSPCIDIADFGYKGEKKENIILTVGRFFSNLHNKKQEVLLDIFINNYLRCFYGWKLIIAGGLTEEGGKILAGKLKSKSRGFPVEILINPSFSNLVKLYKKAKIYWHAAGYGENENIHPEKMEHFGITTLEAMACGTIPIVYKGGGQKDIVIHGQNGFFWQKKEELIKTTFNLITDDKLVNQMSKNAVLQALDYSCDKFYEEMDKLINR